LKAPTTSRVLGKAGIEKLKGVVAITNRHIEVLDVEAIGIAKKKSNVDGSSSWGCEGSKKMNVY
jgi:hypothetical protein